MPAPGPHLIPEILTEILSYAKNDGIEITEPTTYPTNLCLVCKSWRGITLSAPEIWSHIRTDLDRLDDPPDTLNNPTSWTVYRNHKLLSALKVCLDRSRFQPLTISIRAREFQVVSADRKKDLLGSILDAFLRHAQRWLDVSLDFSIDEFGFIFPRGRAYPRLRKLQLLHGTKDIDEEMSFLPPPSHPSSTSSPSSTEMLGAFSNTPHLIELHLHRFPKCVPQLHIPWSQITQFSISMHNSVFFITGIRVVTLMPNLISLTLHYQNPNSLSGHTLPYSDYMTAQFPPNPPVLNPTSAYLPALEYLSISCRERYAQSIAFFAGIRTPRLKTLHFDLHEHTTYLASWLELFGESIRRSQCTITSLSVRKYNSNGVSRLLKLLPDIEELTLEELWFSKELLGHMTRHIHTGKPSSSPPFSSSSRSAPPSRAYVGRRIRRMRIDRPNFLEKGSVGLDKFVAMIKSRLPSSPPEGKSHHDADPDLPSARGVDLASCWVTAGSPPRPSKYGSFQEPAGLHQLLVQNLDIREAESLGVNLVFEEVSDGREMGSGKCLWIEFN